MSHSAFVIASLNTLCLHSNYPVLRFAALVLKTVSLHSCTFQLFSLCCFTQNICFEILLKWTDEMIPPLIIDVLALLVWESHSGGSLLMRLKRKRRQPHRAGVQRIPWWTWSGIINFIMGKLLLGTIKNIWDTALFLFPPPVCYGKKWPQREAVWRWSTGCLSASSQFEHKKSKSKHKQGLLEWERSVSRESITKSEREINKSCSQTERPCFWIKIKNILCSSRWTRSGFSLWY